MKMDFHVRAGVVLACLALAGCGNARATSASGGSAAKPAPKGPLPSVVLVHGAFVDGSGWEGVYRILRRDGYPVSVVQNPTISLADDVAVSRRAIAAQSGSVILVGHSYGGVVISQAGKDPKVAALVYVAAFAPDEGESVQTMIANPPPGAPAAPILPPVDGFVFLDRAKFAASFAADVDADEAAFMAASQVPCGLGALSEAVSTPAWRDKPSFYLVATADKMIPPAAQRSMAKRAGATVTETDGSHAIFVSRPDAVASLIEQAAVAAAAQAK
jgi:pimeloyl-ACP methyl ester carboxylesterase